MLKEKLFPYQVEGVDFMLKNKKCLNLDDCGLGKTAQALGYIDALNQERFTKAILVVKPNNIIQWEEEVYKFTNLSVVRVTGSKARRAAMYRDFITSPAHILLLNYNKVIYDYEDMKDTFAAVDVNIFDEAFALKSNNGMIRERFENLTSTSERVVMLTATPVGSTLFDFYNIMKVMHISLPSEDDFIAQYVEVEKMFTKMGYNKYRIQSSLTGSKNIDDFKETYGQYFIHRQNTDQYDFSLNVHRVANKFSEEQKLLCRRLKEEFQNQGPDDKPIPAVSLYSRFAQIADSAHLIDTSMAPTSPKIEKLVDMVKDTDEQFVVYAKYMAFHSLLEATLAREGITYTSITGKVSTREKDLNKKKFVSGEAQILLITEAGKEGLNLQTARNLVLLDVPATPSDCFQFIGRVYRTGQCQDVNIYFFYMEDSLEEDQFSTLIRRQEDIDILLDQQKGDTFSCLPRRDKIISFLKRDYR